MFLPFWGVVKNLKSVFGSLHRKSDIFFVFFPDFPYKTIIIGNPWPWETGGFRGGRGPRTLLSGSLSFTQVSTTQLDKLELFQNEDCYQLSSSKRLESSRAETGVFTLRAHLELAMLSAVLCCALQPIIHVPQLTYRPLTYQSPPPHAQGLPPASRLHTTVS